MNRQIRFSFFILCVLGLILPVSAQVVYLPTSHEAYDFLKRMEARQLIADYRDAAKPFSRIQIARFLNQIEPKVDQLTWVERERYEFLKSEFSYERGLIAGDPAPTDLRWHLLGFDLFQGRMNIDLNLAFRYEEYSGTPLRWRAQGIKTYGYAFRGVGFYFNFADFRESGDVINFDKTHTPDQGVVNTKRTANSLEYNSTEAQFTVQLGDFELSLEKMSNVWGFGRRGNLIFSTKPPSYPQFKLKVPLTSWMDFIYLHADLHSAVIDSGRSYFANSSQIRNFTRTVYREKYMAAHQLEFTIVDGLDFSIGESIVYSDKGIQFIYLIPVMFFKSAEHYNRDTDNAQIFSSIDLNLIPRVNLYGTLFIDELTTDAITDPNQARNQLGYTVGMGTYDLLLENTEFYVEYSRLNPWVYSHKYPAATFTNNTYDMGHWIGQNADDIYIDVRYTPTRMITVGAFWERYRKGGKADVAYQYETPSLPFLYAPVRTQHTIGAYGQFQFVRDGFLNATIRSVTIEDEGMPAQNVDGRLEYQIEVRYGIW